MTESKQTTSSGRQVKTRGMNDSKKSALDKLKAAREGGIKRTDQYEVSGKNRGGKELDCGFRFSLKMLMLTNLLCCNTRSKNKRVCSRN